MIKINNSFLSRIEDYYDMTDSDNYCFLCENPRYQLEHQITNYDFNFTFKKCQCGLVKQTPLPNEKFFEWFFNSGLFLSSKRSKKSKIWGFYDFYADEPSRLETSRQRFKKLKHLFEKNKVRNIMKIGPATGTFLFVAQEHGYKVLGCDVSSQFVEYAINNYNVNIDKGRFEHINYSNNQFDAILLFNLMENIPNQSEFLQEVYRTLRPGGYFILNFVDMENNFIAKFQRSKYFLYRPPICYIYSLSVIGRILDKFGFKLTELHRDFRYMHIEKISTLLGWYWLLAVARILKIHRIHFPIYAYPSKIIVAQKIE